MSVRTRSAARRPTPLGEQAFAALHGKILTLELEPGRMLSEASVSDMLGVSRTPAREALARLAEIGFVDILPQRGTRVAPLRMIDLEKSQFMREALEIALLRRVMRQDDRGSLVRELRKEVMLQREHVCRDDDAAFYASDERFHGLLAASGSPSDLMSEILRVKDHMDRFRHLMVAGVEDLAIVVDQHAGVVDAIAQGDATLAEELMTVHLRRILAYADVARERYPHYFEPASASPAASA